MVIDIPPDSFRREGKESAGWHDPKRLRLKTEFDTSFVEKI